MDITKIKRYFWLYFLLVIVIIVVTFFLSFRAQILGQSDLNEKNDIEFLIFGIVLCFIILIGIWTSVKRDRLKKKLDIIPPEPIFKSRNLTPRDGFLKNKKRNYQKSSIKGLKRPIGEINKVKNFNPGLHNICKFCGKSTPLDAFLCPHCFGRLR